jgi:guanylate kinase
MSRIVIVGRCAAGKDYLKNQFIQRGFLPDISYTTRKPRNGEINEKDYYFISEKEFNKMIDNHEFYEFIKFGDNYYGTGLME